MATVRDSGRPASSANARSARSLAGSVDDVADEAAGQPAVDDLEAVGPGMVDAELSGEVADDLDEPAGDHGDREAEALQRPHQGPGTGTEPNRRAHLVEDGCRQALEDGDALSQAGREVELTAHGRLGDGGDLCLTAGVGRQQLDDLVLDQRGVDVHDHQAATAPGQAGGRHGDVDPVHARLQGELAAQRR